ncbi:MAG: fibronectin type III domain-containing protein [Gammaproteobacteria bacterium]
MNYTRNILLYLLFAIVLGGCGGGSTTITGNNTSNATSNSTSNNSSTITSSTGTTTTASTGSVTLQWSAPTTWADGTAASLSSISSYRLYYGPSATDTPNFININDSTATQYTITLPSGTYYFCIAAIDSSGYEGLKSSALKKTL